MTLHLEYLIDEKGKQKSVVIPQKEWNYFQTDYHKTKKKLEVLLGIQEALREVKEIQSGKKKAKTLQEVLDEL
ncbi:MAG: hypothetical protein FJ218_08170 [Ignavibacteria bacterium]|nr:hypothetical protein [Ignavibacteria bacterium]